MVTFTPRLLYPWGSIAQFPIDKKLGRPQSRSRHFEEEINVAGYTTPSFQPIAHI
jgi:hypothetical protein